MSFEGIGVILLVFFLVVISVYGAFSFRRQRRQVVGRFDQLGLKSMAARLGLALDPEDVGKPNEDGRLMNAMIRCNRCRSVEDCEVFLADDQADASSLIGFCPNARFLFRQDDEQPLERRPIEVA